MTTRPATSLIATLPTLLLVALGAAGPAHGADVPAAPLHPSLPSPADFVRHVDNRFLPLEPGTRWVYRGFGSEAGEHDVVTVLARTRRVAGIRATVVHDVVRVKGRIVEDTHDWFGQDDRGNVWYLGEATRAYLDDGSVSTEGSWEAGIDGAEAGIAMWASPHLGRAYRQEYDAGNAEDVGVVVRTGVTVAASGTTYDGGRLTMDTTPLEPADTELKFYAPGVGTVLSVDVSPDQGRSELVRMVTRAGSGQAR